VTSVALIGTLWTWGIIMLAHRGYKKAVHEGRARGVSYRMPGAPLANWLVVGFLIVVAGLLLANRQRASPFMSRQYGSPCSASLTSALNPDRDKPRILPLSSRLCLSG